MLIFSLFTEIFIYEKWRPKEANSPEGLYIILAKSDDLCRCDKTKIKGIWIKGSKLWENRKFKEKINGRYCYREEQNMIPYWICFFYFNLCFRLLLLTNRILFIHNGLPQGTPPLCLTVKPKCLCSGLFPAVDGFRKEEINTSSPPGWPFQEIFARLIAFLLYFLTFSPSAL